jgi:hypothetical protein
MFVVVFKKIIEIYLNNNRIPRHHSRAVRGALVQSCPPPVPKFLSRRWHLQFNFFVVINTFDKRFMASRLNILKRIFYLYVALSLLGERQGEIW